MRIAIMIDSKWRPPYRGLFISAEESVVPLAPFCKRRLLSARATRYNTAAMADIYLDHNATTPLDPRVLEAMLPWLGARFGNASAIHHRGRAARNAVEEAREQVAALLGGRPGEVLFTASGTEANNMVVASLCGPAAAAAGAHLVISELEHPSLRRAAERAERGGVAVSRVAPGADGVASADAMIAALRDDTRLVCLMLANNEVGTLQPVAAVAAECRRRGIPLLCDAVQAVGKVAVEVARLGVDLLVLGGHKFNGPLGAAALWMREGCEVEPLLVGGSQERRRRASTENVPAVVGLGAAAALAAAELPARTARLAALRDRFEAGLAAAVPGAAVHAQSAPRLPNTSHVACAGLEGEALLIRLDLAGFAVSTGSACSAGVVEPSRLLLLMGIPAEEALASLRISFGVSNTEEEVDLFLAALAREAAALRASLEPAPPARAFA
jgi:cysteine desulfurase